MPCQPWTQGSVPPHLRAGLDGGQGACRPVTAAIGRSSLCLRTNTLQVWLDRGLDPAKWPEEPSRSKKEPQPGWTPGVNPPSQPGVSCPPRPRRAPAVPSARLTSRGTELPLPPARWGREEDRDSERGGSSRSWAGPGEAPRKELEWPLRPHGCLCRCRGGWKREEDGERGSGDAPHQPHGKQRVRRRHLNAGRAKRPAWGHAISAKRRARDTSSKKAPRSHFRK